MPRGFKVRAERADPQTLIHSGTRAGAKEPRRLPRQETEARAKDFFLE
jgi:hypothetical protein